jgi:hypothetical protein
MTIAARLFVVALSASLAGCTFLGIGSPSSISGKFTANSAKTPKLAVVTAEGDTMEAALKVMQDKVGKGTPDDMLPMAYSIAPKTDGTYTMELKSTKPETLFYVYGWDDLDGNGKINHPETLSGKTADGVSFYIFYKSAVGTKEITQDGDAVAMKSSYDWKF